MVASFAEIECARESCVIVFMGAALRVISHFVINEVWEEFFFLL